MAFKRGSAQSIEDIDQVKQKDSLDVKTMSDLK